MCTLNLSLIFVNDNRSVYLYFRLAEASDYRAAASNKELEAKGIFLSRLVVTDEHTGLYGRYLITFQRPYKLLFPDNKFRLRDIVEIQQNRKPLPVQGVVYRKTDDSIMIAFESHPGDLSPPVSLLRLGNDVTYQRLNEGLGILSKIGSGSVSLREGPINCHRIFNHVFGKVPAQLTDSKDRKQWSPTNPGLNEEQVRAVTEGLASKDVYLIHGPPGTGLIHP